MDFRRSTHSALSSIQTSLHRAVSLRRALSENFVSFLDDTAAISNFASSKARTRPGGMTGAGSLDELGTWNEEVDEEYGDDVSDDYYGGEDDGSPPGIPDSPLSSMSSPRGETFSDILHALKFNSDAYFSRNDADGPLSSTLNGGSESDDADSTTAYDRDLLAEFEQTYSARRAMAEGTNARIDALFDMIQALSEGTDRGPALSPASDIEPLFPSPVKRSLVTNTRLSELMSLEEAIIGLTGGIGVSGGGGRKKPLSPVTKLLRRRDLLEEPLSEIVQRNKSLPVEILEELEEADYMELVPLLPTITRFSLRELDMDEVLDVLNL
ncbi:hypothetical protein BC830DRAFT_628616 [Chytriomyces sp. MP71]|nr:hypothetical protein BC830DRAFT_628616 [Chytriomyces sp. MP71]